MALCLVGLVATFAVSPWHPSFRFHPSVLRELVGFGSYAMFSTITVFIIRNVDSFSVGRILGTTPLGFYDLAYRIGNVTTTQITHVVGKVAFPAYVKMGRDIEVVRGAYLKAYRWLSLVTIPVTCGIITFVPSFLHVFYGNKWDEAIVAAQIIALYGLTRGLFSHAGGVFMSFGRINELFLITLGQLVVLALAIYPVVAHFQLVGLAALLATLNFFTVIIAAVRINVFIPKTIGRYLKISLPHLAVALVTIPLPALLWTQLVGDIKFFSLTGLIICCSLLYAAVTLKREPEIIEEVKGWLVTLKSSGGGPTMPGGEDDYLRDR
jgi:O-antigen/teichoic acid export membrane protein